MPVPPITRKPIPKTYNHWRSEAEGWYGFLSTVNGRRRDMGSKWVDSQRTYCQKRLADLIDNAPFPDKVPRKLKMWRSNTIICQS